MVDLHVHLAMYCRPPLTLRAGGAGALRALLLAHLRHAEHWQKRRRLASADTIDAAA